MRNNRDRGALLEGLTAVMAFAATLPLTRLALEGFAPLPLTFGRMLGAAIAAFLMLNLMRAPFPQRHQLGGLVLVTLGGVYAFPLLTALALEGRSAALAAVPLALMPLTTALWARLRAHEHPPPGFWLWAAAGSLVVLHFVWNQGASILAPELFGAALAASVAYAEGGRLAREMPGWQVMAWALILALPGAALGFGYTWADLAFPAAAAPWLALGFLALITQFGAFWFWYRALACGVIRTSQLQLLQPFLTLLLAAVLLGEAIPPQLWLYAALVVVTVHLARARARQGLKTAEETNA